MRGRDLLPELVEVPLEDLQPLLALLLFPRGRFGFLGEQEALLLHLEHQVGVALELLLLLGLDRLEEDDLLLVKRQLLAQAADLLGELLDFGLLDAVLEPVPVRVAEN